MVKVVIPPPTSFAINKERRLLRKHFQILYSGTTGEKIDIHIFTRMLAQLMVHGVAGNAVVQLYEKIAQILHKLKLHFFIRDDSKNKKSNGCYKRLPPLQFFFKEKQDRCVLQRSGMSSCDS
ncbi:uncharacterized protein PHALS_12112 [Plasmopara halstedii]|uniref:Uncharacterized protein n=1 Tax=Plasmopara halstedii TaxID=4781 RepID=A0A0P1ALM2_PLAHL|nr:uncharacterized protein PHALS_12112 [Plasmopara halstedii]CEG41786.1 hypothetical protein PHALS_12112 [Plasmopara halstedii]|eukprot:XP_024578155.1 hypothetical protein PHALS_12112 [Plasmopara halstedii]